MNNQQDSQWNPDQYARHAGFVAQLGRPVVDLLAPTQGERILDLGCGDGALTRALADAGCRVTGVDASPEMVAAARERGLDARVVDGQSLDFRNEFDAVFSNAALHWMPRPEGVLEGVWYSLHPGGRFVGEMGGQGNVSTIVTALEAALAERGLDPAPLNPWYFPSAEDYRTLLEARGFEVTHLESFARPTPLPHAIHGWLATFAHAFVMALPEREREPYLEEVAERCRPRLCDEAGNWTADYVRLRFAARKPGQQFAGYP